MPTESTERVHLSVAEARGLSERAMRDRRIHDALIALAEGKSRLIACRTP
jgi:hypothetical protein